VLALSTMERLKELWESNATNKVDNADLNVKSAQKSIRTVLPDCNVTSVLAFCMKIEKMKK